MQVVQAHMRAPHVCVCVCVWVGVCIPADISSTPKPISVHIMTTETAILSRQQKAACMREYTGKKQYGSMAACSMARV
jgi:hypothetical protein